MRYADDCNIYVRSQRAGERVMASISRFLAQKLKLKVNQEKSAVARPGERKFLGFSFTFGSKPEETDCAQIAGAVQAEGPGTDPNRPRAWSWPRLVEQSSSLSDGLARLLRLLRNALGAS